MKHIKTFETYSPNKITYTEIYDIVEKGGKVVITNFYGNTRTYFKDNKGRIRRMFNQGADTTFEKPHKEITIDLTGSVVEIDNNPTNEGLYVNQDNKLKTDLVDFHSFPESVLKTLDEYDYYLKTFDWNEKMDEYGNKFGEWIEKYKSDMFLKNINEIIKETTQDMILLKKRDIAEKKLRAFEEIIESSLGSKVLSPALSKFQEIILMNPNATIASIEKGFQEAKNIIDKDGSVNQLKITPSKLFKGGEINYPAFENFVKENPEFQGVYNDWKKILDECVELTLNTNLNAFRDSTSIDRIRELRNFLIDYKKRKL